MPCAAHSCLMVRLRCRFIQAVAALSLIPSSVALLLMLSWASVVKLASCFLLLLFRYLFCDSIANPSSLCSACHHSVRLHSPALRPVFIQLARTGFLVEGEGFEPPMFPFRAVTLHFAIVASALAASLSFSFGRLTANLPFPYAASKSRPYFTTHLHLSRSISPDANIL